MNKRLMFLMLLVLLITHSLPAMLQAQEKTTVAVLNFGNETREKEYNWLSSAFADLISKHLSDVPDLQLVQRRQIVNLLKEQQIREYGLKSQSLAEEYGKALEADRIVFGAYTVNDGTITVQAKLSNIASGQLITRIKKQFPLKDFGSKINSVVGGITLRLFRDKQKFLKDAPDFNLSSTLSANRLYFEGKQKLIDGEPAQAYQLFGRAVELDTGFHRSQLGVAKTYLHRNRSDHFLKSIQPLIKTIRQTELKNRLTPDIILNAYELYGKGLERNESYEKAAKIYGEFYDFYLQNRFPRRNTTLNDLVNENPFEVSQILSYLYRRYQMLQKSGQIHKASDLLRRLYRFTQKTIVRGEVARPLQDKLNIKNLKSYHDSFRQESFVLGRTKTVFPNGAEGYIEDWYYPLKIYNQIFHRIHYLNSRSDVYSSQTQENVLGAITLTPNDSTYSENYSDTRRIQNAFSHRLHYFVPRDQHLTPPGWIYLEDGTKPDSSFVHRYLYRVPEGYEVDGVRTKFKTEDTDPGKYLSEMAVFEYPHFVKTGKVWLQEPDIQGRNFQNFHELAKEPSVRSNNGDSVVTQYVPLPSGTRQFVVSPRFNRQAMDVEWSITADIVPRGEAKHDVGPSGSLEYYFIPSRSEGYLDGQLIDGRRHFGELEYPSGTYEFTLKHPDYGTDTSLFTVPPNRERYLFGNFFMDYGRFRRKFNGTIHDVAAVRDESGTFIVSWIEETEGHQKFRVARTRDFKTWESPQSLKINRNTTIKSISMTRTRSGKNVIVWSSDVGDWNLFVSVSENGKTWSPPRSIVSTISDNVAVTQSKRRRYWVANTRQKSLPDTSDARTDSIDQLVVRSSNDLINWSEPTVVAETGNSYFKDISIEEMNNGELMIVYSLGYKKVLGHISRSGEDWSDTVVIQPENEYKSSHPKLFKGYDDEMIVSFKGSGPTFLKASKNFGRSWSGIGHTIPHSADGDLYTELIPTENGRYRFIMGGPWDQGIWSTVLSNVEFNY